MGGDDISRGRVEYCYNGSWYSLCADGWETVGEEARVICETAGQKSSRYSKFKLSLPYANKCLILLL